MMRKYIPVEESFAEWRKDPQYVAAYEALEEEFALASALIKARGDADMTQEQVAQAMGTTQAVVARLESGKTMPSTRTLERFAKATGTKLRIRFEPVGGIRDQGIGFVLRTNLVPHLRSEMWGTLSSSRLHLVVSPPRFLLRRQNMMGIEASKFNQAAPPNEFASTVYVADFLFRFYKTNAASESSCRKKARWNLKLAVVVNEPCFASFRN